MKSDIKSRPANIQFGFRGWQFDHWKGVFYPDDMPEEWWFSYYSNEFRTVLIPWDRLQATQADGVQDWFDDADDDFQFYIEVPLATAWDELRDLIAPLQTQLAGTVLTFPDTASEAGRGDRHKIKQSEKGQDVAKAVDLIQNLQRITRLIVDYDKIQGLSPELRNLLQTQCGCYGYHTNLDSIQCDSKPVLIEVTDSELAEPRLIRDLLEKCFALDASSVVVFFSGDKPDVSSARNAQTVCQLLAG